MNNYLLYTTLLTITRYYFSLHVPPCSRRFPFNQLASLNRINPFSRSKRHASRLHWIRRSGLGPFTLLTWHIGFFLKNYFICFRTSPAIPPVPPKRQGSHLSTHTGASAPTGTQPTSSASSITGTQDQVKVYALEDTPQNFSTATSLSDLTVDEASNSGRVSVDSQDGLIQHHQTFQPQASTHR